MGEFTFLYSSCFSISSSLADIIRSFDNLNFESEYFVSYLRVILEYKPKIENDLSDDKLHIDKINQIEFRNVTFKYPGHKQIVLDDLSFTIKQNEKVALVGKNGAGKSTIIKLLMRLYDVSQGEVLINNIDIKKYNIKELRKCYSSVMQDYNIFAFSIKDNLCLGRDIPDKQLEAALENSGLLNKIKKLINTYNSVISREFDEKGIELSGGERQKLAIARAIISKATVLILDEANSSLDPLAEYELNKNLVELAVNRTALFVSHRLSTTVICDKIIMLDQGRIVNIGTHQKLIEDNGLYYDMFTKQANAYKANLEVKIYQ